MASLSARVARVQRPTVSVVAAGLAAAVMLTPFALAVPARLLAAALVTVALVIAVWRHPPAGAYVLLVVTPLTAGIERGTLVPVLRPHEAVGALVAAVLSARGAARVLSGERWRPRVRPLDAAIVLLAAAGSAVPLLWLVARGRPLTSDDLLYTLPLWKFFVVYLVVRNCVRTERQVRTCLALSMAAAGVVAVMAMLQSMNLLGVPRLIAALYSVEQDEAAGGRGSATLASSIAVADLMAYNLAIALAWRFGGASRRPVLLAAAVLFTLGALGTGQFTGAIALVVIALAVGVITGRMARMALTLAPVMAGGGLALWPVIATRLQGFQTEQGLPISWTGRLDNLRTYFWPELFSHANWLLGVRPSARVRVNQPWREWVWIESGHTWLLWTGGIPFLLAFFGFLGVALAATVRVARERPADAIGTAAIACAAALITLGVVMLLDPHLTMRGGADLLFALLALAGAGDRQAPAPRQSTLTLVPSD